MRQEVYMASWPTHSQRVQLSIRSTLEVITLCSSSMRCASYILPPKLPQGEPKSRASLHSYFRDSPHTMRLLYDLTFAATGAYEKAERILEGSIENKRTCYCGFLPSQFPANTYCKVREYPQLLIYILSSSEHIAFATLQCHRMFSTTPATCYSAYEKMPLHA